MRPLKRTSRRPTKPLKLGARYTLFQMLAGHLFGATHAVIAAQCCCPEQTLHETTCATGLSRGVVDIVLYDFKRAGLGRYRNRLFSPCLDAFLQRGIDRVARADGLWPRKAKVKNADAVLS